MTGEVSMDIMEATRCALCKHGYADLTMQRIADESPMTTAAIHYHYDTKNDLLNAFLDELTTEVEAELTCEEGDPPERLAAFLDAIFTSPRPASDDFPVALMELKAQAPHNEGYRERFRDLDETMREVLAEIVRDGIEDGQFETATPEEVARFVTTAINGCHVRTVALGEDLAETRQVIEAYLNRQLGWTGGEL